MLRYGSTNGSRLHGQEILKLIYGFISMQKTLSLFRTRRFVPLFITQFFNAFNDNVFKNALVILILYRLNLNSEILVTVAAGIFILPFFIFSALAGQFADKHERASLIVKIKFAEIIFMTLASIGFFLQSTEILMGVLFLVGAQAAFLGPVKYAILPDQLKQNELLTGNAWIEASTFIAILIGTVTGGLLILTPYGISLTSSLIVVVAILGWTSSQFIPKKKQRLQTFKINWNLFKETKNIIQESTQHVEVFRAILGISWFWLIGTVFLSQLPAFSKDILHANQQVVSLFFTLFSVGIAIGSLICSRILKGEISTRYSPASCLGITLFTLDLCRTANHFISSNINESFINVATFLSNATGIHLALDFLFLSICGGIYIVPLYVTLQNRSPSESRARMIGSNNIFNAIFMVIASLLCVFLLAIHFTITQIFLLIALINGIIAFFSWPFLSIEQVKFALRKISKLFYRVKVQGIENYPLNAPRLVIIANHVSLLDGILLGLFLPNNLTFVINLFVAQKWWAAWLPKFTHMFLVDSSKPMVMKSLIEYVSTNKHCVIFPEGRITQTGSLMKIYEGPGLVADRSKSQILPIHIEGAQFTFFSGLRGKLKLRLFPKVTLTIFPPQSLALPDEIKGRERRKIISQKLYKIMCDISFFSQDADKTLFQSLIEAQKNHGKRRVIIEDVNHNTLNYQQLMMRSFIFGKKIKKISSASEIVGIFLPNITSHLVVFFGLQFETRVPALLNFTMSAQQLIKCCKAAPLKTIFTSKKFIEIAKLQDTITALQNEDISIIFLEDISAEITLHQKLIAFIQSFFPKTVYAKNLQKKYRLNQHELSKKSALILFTSGSEGEPKGVALSHYNLQSNRFQTMTKLDFTRKDIVFNALPLFHAFSFNAGLLLPIFSGIRVFIYPSPLHLRKIPELCYTTNATILFSANTFLAGYAKYANPYDFYTLRYVFAGAEKLKEETRKIWFDKFGLRILEGYGATETAPVLAVNSLVENKMGTVGKFLPGIEYRLEPIEGIEEGGELYVKGPNIMLGYLTSKHPEKLLTSEDGWYATGDIVCIDAEGFVTIKDRIKRFAKIGGEMISLLSIETALLTLWPNFNHAAIAQSDSHKGEQIVLFTTYPDATRQEIIKHAKELGLANLAIPRKVNIILKMPLLATGKIDYPKLMDGKSLESE